MTASIDGETGKYFGGTFLSATNNADRVELLFNGTDVWAFGAYRFNHVCRAFSRGDQALTRPVSPPLQAFYKVQLDGGDVQTFSGVGDQEFQRVIFDAHGLDANKEHKLVRRQARSVLYSLASSDR